MPGTDEAVAAGSAAAENVAAQGVLGSLVIVLMVLCLGLIWQLGKAQQARVEDAKKVATDALAREDKWQGVLAGLKDGIERLLDRVSEK